MCYFPRKFLISYEEQRKVSNQEELEWAIGLNRTTLKIVGVWPRLDVAENSKFLENLRVYVTFVLMMGVLLIPELWSLVRVRDDLMLVIDNLQISLPVLSAVLKCSILWWKREAVAPVIAAVESDWRKEMSSVERETMVRQARFTRKIIIAAYCQIAMVLVILNVLPCFGLTMRYVTNFSDPGKPLPVQSHYFYDTTKRSHFLATFAFQTISLVFAAIYFTGVDCFFAFLILHACGQLENLTHHLTNLCNFENIRLGLSFCVREHVRLIRFIRIVDNAVNLMLLGQLFIFTVLFCFQAFLFIKVLREGGDLPILRLIWLIGAIFTILAHMVVYCFVGENLALRCEEVYSATYNCDWYILEPNDAKLLKLILIRSCIPLHITAGKMFPMTMAMFCSVIKTSASYVSVLLAYS